MSNKIVGLYSSVKEIGTHENHYTKIGNFSSLNRVAIVRSVKGTDAVVSYESEEFELSQGMILGENALVDTNNSLVEISDSYGNLYRLGKESQFCIEMTIQGLIPVYFGQVHFEPLNFAIEAQHKYRTSCFTRNNVPLTVEAIAPNIDVYYSYDQPVEVFEYDESGRRFSIVQLDAFQSCTLQNKEGKMRDRYVVIEKNEIVDSELRRLYETYKMPFNWGFSNSDEVIRSDRAE